jgi:hypothetical protein
MRITVTQIGLGHFTPENGEVVASDPCYEAGKFYNRTVKIKPGEYLARACYGVVPGWGERVIELTINHSTTPKKKATTIIGWCGVDSGQCGFFDAENYRAFHPAGMETKESEAWYNRACEITLNDRKHNCGMLESARRIVGAVSESGLGDGQYTLYAGHNSKGEITALRLRFL